MNIMIIVATSLNVLKVPRVKLSTMKCQPIMLKVQI